MAYEMKDGELVFNEARDALDRCHYELDKVFEFITDRLYDEEGEFEHEWSDCNKIRLQTVFNLLANAKEGLTVVAIESGWR